MRIGTDTVSTPAEDPAAYPLDWRLRIARLLSDGRRVNPIPGDRCVGGWLRFLRTRRMDRADRELHERALALRESAPLAALLDALLLTEADYAMIAADLPGLSPEVVQLYEQSLFNVRTDAGELRPLHLLRLRFEADLHDADDMPAMLKKAALAGGYAFVKAMWPSGSAGDVQPAANLVATTKALIERELTRRVLSGRMETRDLLRMKQVQIETERLQHEQHSVQSGADEAWQLVRGILELTAPKLPLPPKGDTKAANDALHNRLASEQRIATQPVQDGGAYAAAAKLNERHRAQSAQTHT